MPCSPPNRGILVHMLMEQRKSSLLSLTLKLEVFQVLWVGPE